MSDPTTLQELIEQWQGGLTGATPAAKAAMDQYAATWRDMAASQGVDLDDPTAAHAAVVVANCLAALTMAAVRFGEDRQTVLSAFAALSSAILHTAATRHGGGDQ